MAAPSPSHPLPVVESFVEVLPVPPQQERRRGVVRFVGLTDFADGEWVGVELVGSEGRNDGSVKGQSYFKCLPGQGVFVRPNLVIPYGARKDEEEKDKAPDPSVARIADLEAQLAAAQQRASESAAAQAKLVNDLHRAEEELASVRAASEAQKTADDDDDFAAQVRAEEERLELQQQVEACRVELKAAQASAAASAEAQAAADTRAKAALAEQQQQQRKAAEAQQQARIEALQVEVAKAHVELTTAAIENQNLQAQLEARRAPSPQPAAQQPTEDPAMKAELEGLRGELQRKVTELQQLHAQCEELTKAQTSWERERDAQQARLTAAESRAQAAEKRVSEVQSKRHEDTVEASSAHAATVADLQAALEAIRAEKARLESSRAAELRATEERCTLEKEAALLARDAAAAAAAAAAAQHEKAELQELCQLLEDELKEEKSQSDELARLVEQLAADKASAEAAVAAVEQQTAQERDRLRREVAEARAREVRLMSAAEDAQHARDAALQQMDSQAQASMSAGPEDTRATAAVVASHNTSVVDAADGTVSAADTAAELAKCRNDLDDAEARIMQLSSTAQVAQELQQRCDELARTMQHQRTEAQRRLDEVQANAAAAQTKSAAEVTLWKRQCVAAQHNATDLANVVAELRRQLAKAGGAGASADGSHPVAPLPGCQLDAAREQRYEAQIALLTRQLLEHRVARMTAVCGSFSSSMQQALKSPGGGASSAVSQPWVKVLDFSTPEACKASTQSLFRSAQ